MSQQEKDKWFLRSYQKSYFDLPESEVHFWTLCTKCQNNLQKAPESLERPELSSDVQVSCDSDFHAPKFKVIKE